MSKNLAIIPARTGSKRLRNKNTLDFFGKPLFIHTVLSAIKSNLFEEVHVSTESNKVKEICEQYELEVKFLRPEILASDEAGLDSVCSFVLDEFEKKENLRFDKFCLLWATAPLLKPEDIIESYQLLTEEADAVASVTDYDLPVYCAQNINSDGLLNPIFPDIFWLKSQDQPKAYCDNGALCWVRVNAFIGEGAWMPKKTKPFFMAKERSVDIDTQEDLDRAKYYYEKNRNT